MSSTLGSATCVVLKRDWSLDAASPGIGQPRKASSDEHYLDWIGLLTAVDRAQDIARVG